MDATSTISVFSVSTTDGGVVVALPRAWAGECETMTVDFWRAGANLGWHLRLNSDREPVMDFPYADHVDQVPTRCAESNELPGRRPAADWADSDQGWWAVVRRLHDEVSLAQADFDELVDNVDLLPESKLVRPGLV